LEKDGKLDGLADSIRASRLNSRTTLCISLMASLLYRSALWLFDEKKKELDFQGIYRLATDGKLQLLNRELSRPNGLRFSPDEKTLYVANSDPKKKTLDGLRFALNGTLVEDACFST